MGLRQSTVTIRRTESRIPATLADTGNNIRKRFGSFGSSFGAFEKIGTLRDRLDNLEFTSTIKRDQQVLPSLLERVLNDINERVRFEEFVEGTDGEFLVSMFKPLMYFELASFERPRASLTIAKLFAQLYVQPNMGMVYTSGTYEMFDRFLSSQRVSPQTFTDLKEDLDKEISNRYLLDFKREDLKARKDVRASVMSNKSIDLGENSAKVFSQTLPRALGARTNGSMTMRTILTDLEQTEKMDEQAYPEEGLMRDDETDLSDVDVEATETPANTTGISSTLKKMPMGLAPPGIFSRRTQTQIDHSRWST